MSFGGSFGGGFGSSNQNQTNSNQSGAFGFGTNNNNNNSTAIGFGTSTASNTGFGSTSTNTNPFGGGGFGTNTNTGGGFGATNNNSNSLFGAPKSTGFGTPASSSGNSLFGGTATSNNAFSGGNTFGASANTNTGFGNTNTGGGFNFGAQNNANKPAFGSSSTSAPLFGQGGTGTTGGFGSTTGFGGVGGAGSGTALNQPVPPSDGTAVTPFSPTNEKDPAGSSTSSYQSISFMQPYQKYSFEELRLGDYNAGRRFGNGSGQAGAFGASSTFGGFGSNNNTNTGFGTSNSNPFGAASTSASTGFGTTATSGFGGGNNSLFGAKPAGSNLSGSTLFGSQPATTTSGSSLFGNSNNTSSGFGSNTATNTGFGNTNTSSPFGSNQNQNKPGGLFGSTNTGTTGFSFGNNNNNTSSPFGGSGTSNVFGNNNNQQQQQQQQQPSTFGTFGNQNSTQAKPLFGGLSTSTQSQPSGGLFGAAPSNNTGGLFGNTNTNNQNQSSGLFGGSANTGGNSLFGGNNSASKSLFNTPNNTLGSGQNQSGGLFGSQNQPQQQQSSLFGGNSNNSGGLFGNSTANKPASSFSFGAPPSNNQSSGLFGSMNNNSTNNAGGSLFGNSQNNQQAPQQGALHSSLLDGNPYGQSSIWSGLPSATSENSGPLVTPLTASQRLKESQAKPPSFRMQSPKIMTPPRRQGFGISYSTYGTPNSVTSTPGGVGLSSSMYGKSFTGGSFGRSMGKSFSTTNLRQQFAADGESILSPGAFAPGSSRHSGGSIRRLTIDRSLKTDLFKRPELPSLPVTNGTTEETTTNSETPPEQPGKLKKRVSFDKETTRGGTQNEDLNGVNGALVRTESDDSEPTAEEQGFLRSSRRGKGPSNSTSTGSESDQSRGNELAVVPEDRESDTVASKASSTDALAIPDPKPGEYWMKPSRTEIRRMPREKLQQFNGFEVGRYGCGHVTFDGPVDLTTLPLDDVYEKLVEIRLRSITVYPDANTKPPMGKGLNVPSTLRLENSWPRSRNIPSSATSGPLFDKHVMRLKKMTGTQFVKYDTQTGVWTFRVPHFTRYGLDYDDDDDEPLDESTLSAPPDSLIATPQPGSSIASATDVEDDTPEESSPEDDTFAFKQRIVPGGFGRHAVVEDEQDESFLGEGPAAAPLESELSEASEVGESDTAMDMAGSFPHNTGTAEHHTDNSDRPILKASQWGTPGKALLDFEGDWAEQLQRTISPRKQNREALREAQGNVLLGRVQEPMKQRTVSNKKEFRTSIDVMNSLFGKHEERMAPSRKQQAMGSGFEWPYSKRAKIFDANSNELSEEDQAWHVSFKPKWTPTGSLLYAQGGMTTPETNQAWEWHDERIMAGEGRDIVESSLQGDGRDLHSDKDSGLRNALIAIVDGVPYAKPKDLPFSVFCDEITQRDTQANPTGNLVDGLAASRKLSGTTLSGIEMEVYQLAHVLFDDYEDQYSAGLTQQQKKDFRDRIRKDRLSSFFTSRIAERHAADLESIQNTSLETAAMLHLSLGDSAGASDRLMQGKNYHLSTLIAQIQQAEHAFQEDMESQLADWRQQSIVSEISDSIRTFYELLAGNTTISQGKSDGPLEDRASTFSISDHFGFDWMQAFGLCLWYGKQKNGTIEDVVRDYAAKLESKEESAFPFPDGADSGESPLWVLLKIFAYQSDAEYEPPVLPQALASLSKSFDSSVTFQLHHTLVAHISHLRVDAARADQLATDLAFQYSAAGSYFNAVFTLMHISNAAQREASIKDLLNRHASYLPEILENTKDAGTEAWTALTKHLKIPKQWVCAAKALYARSQNMSIQELRYLIAAEQWIPAHDCLCRRVAPRAVMDEDWQVLRDALDNLKGKEDRIPDWAHGGGMYHDFLDLAAAHKVGHKDSIARVRRLQSVLAAHGQRFKNQGTESVVGGIEELEERVACKEMARLVADLASKEKDVQKKMILDLPLTTDARLSHTRELSVNYYRAAMATAR